MTSITEELREYAQASFGDEHQVAAHPYLKAIEAIADLIDARHTKTFEVGIRWMKRAARFEAENVRLREMASLISEYISHDRCEGCIIKTLCNNYELDVCWMITKLRNQLREMGMEVDDD